VITQFPYEAVCDSENASVWVCEHDSSAEQRLTTCAGFGIIPADPTFSLLTTDSLQNGFGYVLNVQNGRPTTVIAECKEDYPEGHIATELFGTSVSGSNLTIHAKAFEFCVRDLPTPMPVADGD
jgi:hypothetical protein